MPEFAIYYEPSSFSFTEKTMGRQAAGSAFVRAIANSRPERVWCYAQSRNDAQNFAETISKLGSPKTGVGWIPINKPELLSRPGLLFRPDPVISSNAWHRQGRSDQRAYSLCGITHTISTHNAITAFSSLLTSPLQSWDALICTSKVARDSARFVLEQQADYLRESIGASRFTLPQMPVIPLGVHTQKFAFSEQRRAAARANLGLATDEVAVLFAGRLIVHGKAHPLPMYLALEQASKGKKIVLLQAGIAPNDSMRKIYEEEPRIFCPSVRVVMVDGRNEDLFEDAWAGADIFTSLSDNIQETFGLTPLEAMAAGIPSVVSDWNGYKDTVRDGIDGFRVPTLSLPPGQGSDLADSYDMGLINFDYYSGYASQLVAVDVNAAAQAYSRLIADSNLRKQMGQDAAKRAHDLFDWSKIFQQYVLLWEELAERRRADPQVTPRLTRRRRPDRPDPFAMFSTYPTHHVGSKTLFRARAGADFNSACSRRDLSSTSFARTAFPTDRVIEAIISATASDWVSLSTIISDSPDTPIETMSSALTWLSKMGILEFKES